MAEHPNKRRKVLAETDAKTHGSRSDLVAVGSSTDDADDVPAENTDPPWAVDRAPYPQMHLAMHNIRMGNLQRRLLWLHEQWHRTDDFRPQRHTEPLVAPMLNTATFVEQLRMMADRLEQTRTQHEGEVE